MVSTSTHQVSQDFPSRKQWVVKHESPPLCTCLSMQRVLFLVKYPLSGYLFICPNCYQLVSYSHRASHPCRCNQSSIANVIHSPTHPALTDDLPTFEQVCQLNHPTLRFIPPPVIPNYNPAPLTLNPDFDIFYVLRSFPRGSGAGPSGLSAEQLLDAASIHLPTPIASSLRSVVNLLVSGKVPLLVSVFLAFKGEVFIFFQPFQFGVACKAGAEKVIHSLTNCVEANWQSGDFVIFKVDMSNAFNLFSREAVLEECATFFPELMPWVIWCYGSRTSLFHPQGRIWSQSGVHQGDPLGPLLFALLVLHKLVYIEADDECLNIFQQN